MKKVSSVLIVILFLSTQCTCLPDWKADKYTVEASMPAPVVDRQSFINWLQSTGRPVCSRYSGYVADYDTYANYNLLSYGTPQMVPGNRFDGTHYAMHGFSYDEYTVTNSYFRDDTTGVSDPRNWNNISLGQDSAVSWMRLTQREKDHIKNSSLYYSGKDFNGMSFSSLRLTEEKCVVIAIPSWRLGFALYTRHYNSAGQIRYGTLTGNGIGDVIIDGSLAFSNPCSGSTVIIQPDQNDSTISININSYIQSYGGLARDTDISRGGITLDDSVLENPGAGPWNMSQSVRFSRTASNPSMDYSRTVSFRCTIWAVSLLGDIIVKDLSFAITVIEKARIYINGTMSIHGAISLFKGGRTLMGYPLEDNPKRFLCLEQITLRIDFNGFQIPDYVEFNPVGMAPCTVNVIKVGDESGFAELVYPMGIIQSTLTWGDIRVRPPYECSASAFYGNNKTEYSIQGIEITGDIYDMVYLDTTA